VDPIFAFPAGTEAGQYLHELLELLDFPTARGEMLRETARELFARYGGLGVAATAEVHWLGWRKRW
jgi:hypothetical protein